MLTGFIKKYKSIAEMTTSWRPKDGRLRHFLRASLSTSSIIKQTGACKKTVFNITKRVKEGKGRGHALEAGCPVTTTVQEVKDLLVESPTMSMRLIAKDLGVDERTIRRKVKEALVRQAKPRLTVKVRHHRIIRAAKLLSNIKSAPPPGRVIFFSDERTFTVDPVRNSRTDRHVALEDDVAPSVKFMGLSKHPQSAM